MRTYIEKLTRSLQKSAIFFFFIKLISIYQNPLLHVVLHNHTDWLTTLWNTYTVGLTCILWTKSNYELYILCLFSFVSTYLKAFFFFFSFFYNIYLWKSFGRHFLKNFNLHLENLSSTLDNQLQLEIPPVCQNWTGF